ncbi:MAG: hypothetical protein LBD93_11000 [Treponema sp.]|nr:hypothetical protein [Treponema sp.]
MSYIPDKEAEFIKWSENFIKGSKEHAVELGLPTDKLSEIETLHIEVKVLHEKYRISAYTKVDMQMKNEKRELLKKKEAEFVLFHLQNNDKMTDAVRKELRIPIYDKTHTPHPKPASVPEIDIAAPTRGRCGSSSAMRIRRVGGSPNLSTGLNVCGLQQTRHWRRFVTCYGLRSAFTTRSPLELEFEDDERGKRGYFAVRWESGMVKKGPRSDIFNAVIQ